MSPIFTPSKFGFASQSGEVANPHPWITEAGDLFSGYTIFESEVSTSTKTLQATNVTAYALTNLPSGGLYSGMSLNTSTGVLSGDFGADATYTMTGTTTPAGESRTFTITVAEDLSISAFSNLQIWMRGGYNGRTAASVGTSGDAIPLYGGTGVNTDDFYGKGSPSYIAFAEGAPPATGSLGASGSGIRDAKGGSSAALQDDLLYYNTPANSTVFFLDAKNSGLANSMTHTFAYWMQYPNISAVHGSSKFNPIWHSWNATNAIAHCAHDWHTNGTSNIYLNNYVAGGLYGAWTTSTVTAGSNGNKGVWLHLATVYTSGTTKCYLNGALDATLTAPTGNWGTMGDDQTINFNGRGDGYDNSNTAPGSYTSGWDVPKMFADNRYYNAALSAAQIEDIYQKGRSQFA